MQYRRRAVKELILKFNTQLLLVLIIAPNLAFAKSFLTPNLSNYGTYKNLSASEQPHMRKLMGHVPKDLDNLIKVGSVEKDRVLEIGVMLPWHNEDELDELIIDIINPESKNFGKYLKQDEFYARFAPTKAQLDRATKFLKKHGFSIERVTKSRHLLILKGTVQAINEVFHTEINYYKDKDGKQFFAPAYELQVDKELDIIGALSLYSGIQFKRAGQKFAHARESQSQSKEGPCPSCASWSGAGSLGLSPSRIISAYSLFSSTSSNDGTGQTLALFEFDNYHDCDIACYASNFNLGSPSVARICVDPSPCQPPSGTDGQFEVSGDIEMMLALAPKAKIRVYIGDQGCAGIGPHPNNCATIFIETYGAIANENPVDLAQVVSTSWFIVEISNTATLSLIFMESQVFKQMTAQGQTIFAASGDRGSYANEISLSVIDPASQPLVVAVGGTNLTVNTADYSYNGETGWGDGQALPNLAGSGGGVSTIWLLPYWQKGLASPSNLASMTFRNLPDVALMAGDIGASGIGTITNPRYAIIDSNTWFQGDGTSFAAPLWAAFTALVNEARKKSNNQLDVIGFFSPTLYQIAQSTSYSSTFHDITAGSNGPASDPTHYPAVVGYDLVTGWGSFQGDNLFNLLSGIDVPPPPR